MTTTQALPYVSVILDDALSAQSVEEWQNSGAHNGNDLPHRSVLVGWQCGFEPMFVAVHSYLPGIFLDEDEATELALDYLDEKEWFSGSSRDREPDYLIRT